ncbi:MAG: hypothetical protein SGJ00_14955 [bacterium]|nr:hypothetical protein [bacterium]
MKNQLSFIACFVLGLLLLFYRFSYPGINSKEPLKLTTWDAYGYYLYLPSTLIYHDVKTLTFQDSLDKKYQLSGGNFYQANMDEKSGNYVFKYLGGIAILHLPFFVAAHLYALNSTYEADGFSAPYQNAIGFGVVLYGILALFILRRVLLKYYSDEVTAVTLLLTVAATNAIQYFSIDNCQSHAPIFLLYTVVLWLTIKWHEKPSYVVAFFVGYIIGLATISRPTEAIMVLIPILWGTQSKDSAKEKWALVKANMPLVYLVAVGGVLGILPQLIYWQYVTGFFIYDVGSAWRFLTPFFRVLFGFEKGWFIYTPVTIFFVLGLFYIKNFPFRKSLLWFCLLNIWIIISWSDWKYGGSYTTRALMQSYPVFALALGAFLQRFWVGSNRIIIAILGLYLIGLNLFQIWQYNTTTLHYYDMNRAYYGQIYLNPNPSPLQKSLLDNPDWISNEKDFTQQLVFKNEESLSFKISKDSSNYIYLNHELEKGINYLKINAQLLTEPGFGGGYIISQLQGASITKENKVRLTYPGAIPNQINAYSFYIEVPEEFKNAKLSLRIQSNTDLNAELKQLEILGLSKTN